MGLLGSSGDLSRYATAHKDTVAIRDKWRGKFERGTSSRYARVTLERVALREETHLWKLEVKIGSLRNDVGSSIPSPPLHPCVNQLSRSTWEPSCSIPSSSQPSWSLRR
ncbi:hypothetical protein E3N88_24871 [Mikania micrantha]|uniref:Uncharacterized protein n=1 Tax=Mikania micrantha TaxID=192012 RepID=A0A5N6N4E5_9ASTR|nr:hypothetical protein E3N88_24871 [Mikania micrantha]